MSQAGCNMPLKLMRYMLERADSLVPHQVADLAKALKIPQSTAYHALKTLKEEQLVERTPAGWVLSDLVLQAGVKTAAACTKINVNNLKVNLYGQSAGNN